MTASKPPIRSEALRWHKVAALDELPEGRVKTVSCGTQSVCLTHHQGRYGALDNACPHQGGPLGEGSIENGWLRCPWHGWEFDIRTGQSWCDPDHTYVRSFKVSVEPGASLVKGPYVAETVPVRVEGNYVVVEL